MENSSSSRQSLVKYFSGDAMESKPENRISKSVFAVNATASLDFQNGSIEEKIHPLTEDEVRAQNKAQALRRAAAAEAAKAKNEFSVSVTQASSEALRILENQGFGRSINAAAQSLLSNGFMPEPLNDEAAAPAENDSKKQTTKAEMKTGRLADIIRVPHSSVAIPFSAENPPTVAPIIAEYMDYRKMLQDFYLFRRDQSKKQIRPYSYSTFAAAANIKSPNYLKMIIEGKRNLSPEMIGRFAKAMGLHKADADQFRLLVQFNQSADTSERNLILNSLSEMRVENQMKAGEIDRKAWDRLPSWVAWVLYALLDQANVDFRIETLHGLLRGKAKNDEIEAALKSLVDTGEVTFDPETKIYAKSKNRAESHDEIPVALIRKLQSQLMLLGLESLYQDNPTEREFGTLTLALTQHEFEELRFKLRQMRKQAHKDISINRMTTQGDRVYQLNLQLFPVSEKSEVKA